MALVFNKKKGQEKHRYLRKNMPKSEVLLLKKVKTIKCMESVFFVNMELINIFSISILRV
jgi:hypothetical protein